MKQQSKQPLKRHLKPSLSHKLTHANHSQESIQQGINLPNLSPHQHLCAPSPALSDASRTRPNKTPKQQLFPISTIRKKTKTVFENPQLNPEKQVFCVSTLRFT
jgi:hypothetical protein